MTTDMHMVHHSLDITELFAYPDTPRIYSGLWRITENFTREYGDNPSVSIPPRTDTVKNHPKELLRHLESIGG